MTSNTRSASAAGVAQPTARQPRWGWPDVGVVIALVLFVIASRVPFRFMTFTIHDSAHFAWAVADFDVSQYRPHPPGYILFVATAKAFNLLLDNVEPSLFCAVLLYGLLSTVLLYAVTRALFNRDTATIASVLFATAPIFWYHTDVALSYAAGCCLSLLVAWPAYRLVCGEQRPAWMYFMFIALGLCGGIRQDLLFFMMPLGVLAVVMSHAPVRHVLGALAAGSVVVACWAVPLLHYSGGLSSYSRAMSEQAAASIHGVSLLLGGTARNHISMLKEYLLAFFGATVPGLLYLVAFLWRRRRELGAVLRTPNALFLGTWVGPSNLFFALVYFADHGYLLASLAGVYAAIGHAVVSLNRGHGRSRTRALAIGLQVALMAVVNAWLFLSPPLLRSDPALQRPFAEKNWREIGVGLFGKAFAMNNWPAIAGADAVTTTYAESIRRFECEGGARAIILFARGPWSSLAAAYYLNEPTVYSVEDYASRPAMVRIGEQGQLRFIDSSADRPIVLKGSVGCLIFLVDEKSPTYSELMQQLRLEKVALAGGLQFFVARKRPFHFRVARAFFVSVDAE